MPEDFFDHCLEAQAGFLGLMLARQGDNFDPHLDQTKLNGLLPLTIDGVLDGALALCIFHG